VILDNGSLIKNVIFQLFVILDNGSLISSITGRVKSKTVKLVYAAFLLSTSLLWSKSNDWLDRNQDNLRFDTLNRRYFPLIRAKAFPFIHTSIYRQYAMDELVSHLRPNEQLSAISL
jgi:hypothetical protein